MSAVSETIVREYFELHGFFVRQQRKYIAPNRREDEEIDFYVLNPQAAPLDNPLPFILRSADLARLQCAVVLVKGWHTETFSPAVLANAPEIFRFLADYRMLTYGTLLLLLMRFSPQGLLGDESLLWRALTRRAP